MDEQAPFDKLIVGTLVTSDAVIPRGYVAVRGETIAAIGQGATRSRQDDERGREINGGGCDGHPVDLARFAWKRNENVGGRPAAC